VYVTTFPRPGRKWLVSSAGGASPRWRSDGSEIFYIAPDRMLVAAEVNGQGVDFKVRAARPLFAVPTTPGGYSYDVAKDSQRFLVTVPGGYASPEPLEVVLNWQAELKQRVPVK
jgi:hypothetical protein